MSSNISLNLVLNAINKTDRVFKAVQRNFDALAGSTQGVDSVMNSFSNSITAGVAKAELAIAAAGRTFDFI